MPATTLSTSANASLIPYDTIMVGHSLVNHDLPQMLRQLSPVGSSVQEQVINGAPLQWNWDHGSKAEGIDARSTLARGGTDVLVITEAVPLQSHIDWSDSYGYALRWRNAAVEANPGARVYLYETWHSLSSGQAAWRTQLTTDLPKWKAIAEAGQMTGLVPAGQAMAEIYDEIQLGTVPTLTSISDLFTDDIHPNHLGLYLIACVHYAVIYNTSPVGLPRELVGQWGTPYQAPSEALALRMQQIAWEVVSDSTPDTGTPPPMQPPTQQGPVTASVSGVDTNGYLSANQDVDAANINPLEHYHQNGWREGRDASVSFDTTLYLLNNPDVKAAGIDPLEHFLAYGRAEGRQTYTAVGQNVQGAFDAEYYLLANPDVGLADVDAAFHFANSGWKEGRDPNAFFDTSAYLSAYGDVAAAGVNPLEHYNAFGWKEGRDPSGSFDTSSYLQAYADVAAAGVNPLQHYLQFGIYEGRSSFSDSLIG